jgi:hypothetical protein
MKKISLSILALLFILSANCCDICGCSTGTYFIGPFPYFHKHFVGLRYTYRSFHTRMNDDPSQYSKDFYQTAELWGGWRIGKKFQLLAFVPFNINKQTSDDGVNNNSGLGDITLIANYSVFSKKSHGNIKHELWIGGGVKLPTGKFNADQDELLPTANNQAGSGSLDFLVNGIYALHIKKWGVSSTVTYKMNSSTSDFKFGNRLAANTYASYSIAAPKVTYSPNAGLLFENLEANKLSGKAVEASSGRTFQGALGMDVIMRRFAIGANVQLPIAENISDNQTHTNVRGMVHITFLL